MTFQKKIQAAIERLRLYEKRALLQHPDGFYLAFSGGKDSCVLEALAKMAGVKYTKHYSVTTIDPPELVYFIREHHPDTIWERQPKPFLKEFVYRGAPRRQSRWCCAIYKEGGGAGRYTLTGLRWAESFRRKTSRRMFEPCYKDAGKFTLNPIIDWEERDIWHFIGKFNIPYCKLYDDGRNRLGCLFCPMAKQRERDEDVKRYPQFAEAFKRAFVELYSARGHKDNFKVYGDGLGMWDWWISGKSTKQWSADRPAKGKGE